MTTTEPFEHVFRYRNHVVRLIGLVETRHDHRQLILEDVLATSLRFANDVPDERIEAEASKVAHDKGATYL